jgi:translation initiation factor 2B subunit (eIF-2B alpha/beta/delta family)
LEEPRRDATPPHLITLLITDVGVLTPSAVAEEMLRRGPV